MSIGTLASGVLAYAFNVLAARALGPAAYGAVGALWGAMFLLAVLLFRPIEQTVSRAIADHLARGEDARPAVRAAAWLTALVTSAAVAGCVLAWAPITDRLFGGEPVLTVALIAGLAGYGLSYFARGLVGGVQWFGGYGIVLLADGAIRFALALPLSDRRLPDGGGRGDRRGGRWRRCGPARLPPAERTSPPGGGHTGQVRVRARTSASRCPRQ